MSKILFIQVHSGIGGATTSLFQLCSGLRNNGDKVEVLITSGDGPLKNWLEEQGIKVHLLNGLLSYGHGNGARTPFWSIPPFRPLTDLRKLPGTINTYRRFFKQNNYDIIYLNTSILWPAAIAAKREDKKVVSHVREVWYQGLMGIRKKIFIAITERFSDRIMTLSHYSKNQFRLKDKVHVVYNAVDFTRYDEVTASREEIRNELGLEPDRIYILTMGGALPHKGSSVFLKAAGLALETNPQLRFVILGHTQPYYPDKPVSLKGKIRNLLVTDPGKMFRQEIEKYNMGQSLVMPGSIRNVAGWIKASDILVFPATEDHFGRPIIEAGYMRVPAIASDGNTSKELIPNEENGLLFKNRNARDLADKMLLLASDQTLRIKMGQAGRRLAESRYGLENQISTVRNLLQELMEE